MAETKDHFVALSGFLITTLLLRERRRTSTVRLGAFFARRSLRLFPLYYLVLALYAGYAAWGLGGSPIGAHFFRCLPFYATYTGNWFVDYAVTHPVVFGFSWSLATEAQFYAYWPPLVALTRGWKLPLAAMLGLFALDFVAERAGSAGAHRSLIAIVTSLSAEIAK